VATGVYSLSQYTAVIVHTSIQTQYPWNNVIFWVSHKYCFFLALWETNLSYKFFPQNSTEVLSVPWEFSLLSRSSLSFSSHVSEELDNPPPPHTHTYTQVTLPMLQYTRVPHIYHVARSSPVLPGTAQPCIRNGHLRSLSCVNTFIVCVCISIAGQSA
jgi:hypothetical protein